VDFDDLRDQGVDGLLTEAGIGLLHLSSELVVDWATAGAHVLLGRRPGVLVGRSAMETFADHRAEDVLRRALESGSASGELAARGRDARTLLLRAGRAADGSAWAVLQDVSELRRLQLMRAEFIDNLSHELRTPLTTIGLLAETLALDADALPPRAAERVGKIEVETGHLVQMVNEMLDLARIESGARLLTLDDVDVIGLAAATLERIALFAERHGVRLRLDAPEPAPHVRGDAARLGQALLNLIHNAVKFSPPGGEVVVRVRPDRGAVTVAVVDRGPGIPVTAQPRIFERFYKVDRARGQAGTGTGLGLSIARHVVEAHGGRIWVESEEGSGCTFLFSVPAAGPDERVATGPPSLSGRAGAPAPRSVPAADRGSREG
jgi:two-component system phosphate regulon sensor histidine kinase PhoR